MALEVEESIGCLLVGLLSHSEKREHLKQLRIVDFVVTNWTQFWDTNKPRNHKLSSVAVCGLVLSRLIGFFLVRQ